LDETLKEGMKDVLGTTENGDKKRKREEDEGAEPPKKKRKVKKTSISQTIHIF